MKRLVSICALALLAAAAFAQSAPAPKYEIYGSTFFDYQVSGTELAMTTPALSDFTFSKLRFGFRAQIADTLKSTFEFDPRNGEFRHAYVDWTPVSGLTVTAGKTFTNFEQIVAIYGAGRMYLLGAKYAIPGLGWAGLQVANKSDISYISGNYLIFPPETLPTLTPPATTYNQQENWIYQQDPNIYLIPAIVFKPDLGKSFSLEVGLESQMSLQQMTATTPTGLSADAYFTLAGFGATFTNEFAWINLNNTTVSKQELTYYAQATYASGAIAPTVYFVADAPKGDFTNSPNAAIGVEFPITVATNFKINPLFSYAVAGYDPFEGNNAIKDHLYNQNDWTFGIRFDYSYSAKF